ncbi:MAG: agmatine deiminase family protein [Sulfurovum sp.]|nr:agmatine deiminase family protein [Sulfurovum sp.]
MRHIKRRIVMLLLLGTVIWSCTRDKRGELLLITPSYLPHESNAHKKTWIAFHTDEIKHNLILVITAIAQYEPVSILVKKADHKELLALLGSLDTHHYPIEVIESEMNTPWMREEGPTFVWDEKDHKSAINFNFPRVEEEDDKKDKTSPKMANVVIAQADVKSIHSNLTVNASCFTVDGAGTAIMIENCIINDDSNPYWKKEEIEIELKLLLGLQKIIWLKGNEEKTNTQREIQARFVKEGLVLVHRNNNKNTEAYTRTRENIQTLQSAMDAKGKPLEVVIIDAMRVGNKSYLGYYLSNRAVIIQSFGDAEADYNAQHSPATCLS